MGSSRDLCTLSDVKTWLGISTTDADTKLTPLVSQASADILAEINRGNLLITTYTERRNGTGGHAIVLRNWPVISLTSVTIDGQAIPPSADGIEYGYVFDAPDQSPPGGSSEIGLIGYCFGRGRGNVTIVYTAGYGIRAEAQIVANGAASVSAPYGAWSNDQGVIYSTGQALVRVASSPAPGQYTPDPATPGNYLFNAADNGQAILVSYDYVPHVLRQAATELAAERYRYRDRIGQKSKSLGGNETVTFDNAGLTAFVAGRLQNFKDVLPIYG